MKKILWAIILAALTVPAGALNMSGFKDAPITRLTGEEVKAFRSFVMKTLDEAPDGTMVEWKAPKTPFVSKITPQKSFKDGKAPCREATIESDARDRFQRGVYTFCKQSNGEWQFKIPAAKPKAN